MWKSVLYNHDFNSAFIEMLRPNWKDYGGIVIENTVPSTAVLLGKVTRRNVVHLRQFHLYLERTGFFFKSCVCVQGNRLRGDICDISYVRRFVRR